MLPSTRTGVCVCVHVCAHVHVCTHVWGCLCMCVRAHIWVCVFAHMHVCVCACVCVKWGCFSTPGVSSFCTASYPHVTKTQVTAMLQALSFSGLPMAVSPFQHSCQNVISLAVATPSFLVPHMSLLLVCLSSSTEAS